MKKVSIIIPAYNAEKYIKRCIDSIIKQTYKNLEVLIVDDGSTDNTPKILDDIASKDKRIKVIHKQNGGVSLARNVAIEKATGEYIMFTDSDDWLEPDMVEKMLNKAMSTDCDIVICGYNNYYENSKQLESKLLNPKNYKLFIELITDDKTNFGGFPWNKLMKKDCIKNLYNTTIHYFENLLFFLENFNEKTKFEYVNEALYNYSINDTSALHSKKYKLKKVTSLKALELVIPLLPNSSIDFHKFLYVNSFYENLYYIKKEKHDLKLLDEYKYNLKVFYKDVMKSKRLNKKIKIKAFILMRFSMIYFLIKRIKNR